MFSFILFLWGIDKEKRRQVWMEVGTCGESRKIVKSVLIFIYTPAISLSLASKFSKPDTQRIELPHSLSLSPLSLLPSSVPYLPYILFIFQASLDFKNYRYLAILAERRHVLNHGLGSWSKKRGTPSCRRGMQK